MKKKYFYLAYFMDGEPIGKAGLDKNHEFFKEPFAGKYVVLASVEAETREEVELRPDFTKWMDDQKSQWLSR